MNEEDFSKLVSPHGFDARGPVPWEVTEAAKQTARLRVMFLTQDGALTRSEIEELFRCCAVQAEWTREQHQAVHEHDVVPVEDKFPECRWPQCAADTLAPGFPGHIPLGPGTCERCPDV
jgi:hypothetical protein